MKLPSNGPIASLSPLPSVPEKENSDESFY